MGWLPSATRTSSKPSASRTRLRTTSADGVLSIPARAATSEAVSSSSEKCGVIIISRLPLSHRFFETDQGWIDRPAHLILMGLSRDADDLGKSLADVFGCVEAAAPLRFQERHGQVHDFESDIDGHLDSSNDRIAVARSVKFRLSSRRYTAAGPLPAMASRYVNQESRAAKRKRDSAQP